METFWSNLDLLNTTHTRKYQVILEVIFSSYKESSHEQSKISSFLSVCPSYLEKF